MNAPARFPETLAGDFAGLRARMGRVPFGVLLAVAFVSAVWMLTVLINGYHWQPPGYVNAAGAVIGRDFMAFYATAKMALEGQPELAYDHGMLFQWESGVVGAPTEYTPWFYPPFAQILAAPLALLPYLAALAVWLLAPLAGFLIVVRRYAPHPLAVAMVLIFPGLAQCLFLGQNGILSALMIAGGLALLDKRPIAAGLVLGLLSYKPHLAATVFAALLFGGYWRTILTGIATTLTLALASIAAFGMEPWFDFLREAHFATLSLETGHLPWSLMTTIFAAARWAGLSIPVSYACQAVVALVALAALFIVWRRGGPIGERAAVLATVLTLTTPYAYNYDSVIVVIAIFWLAQEGLRTGFKPLEPLALVLMWLTPAASWLLAPLAHIVLTPFVHIFFLGILLRRILDEGVVRAVVPTT